VTAHRTDQADQPRELQTAKTRSPTRLEHQQTNRILSNLSV
jgi:hypothetical protein